MRGEGDDIHPEYREVFLYEGCQRQCNLQHLNPVLSLQAGLDARPHHRQGNFPDGDVGARLGFSGASHPRELLLSASS